MPPIGGTCRKSRDMSEAMTPSGWLPGAAPPLLPPDGEGPAEADGPADTPALPADAPAEAAAELTVEAEGAAALATEGAAEAAAEADGLRGLPVASTFPALIAAISTSTLARTRIAGTMTARLPRSRGRAARSSRT